MDLASLAMVAPDGFVRTSDISDYISMNDSKFGTKVVKKWEIYKKMHFFSIFLL